MVSERFRISEWFVNYLFFFEKTMFVVIYTYIMSVGMPEFETEFTHVVPCMFNPGAECNGSKHGMVWMSSVWDDEACCFRDDLEGIDRHDHFEGCYIKYLLERAGIPPPVKKVKEVKPQQEQKGESIYELTLTTIKDDPYELRVWLHKIVKSSMFSVYKWKACIELTKAGIPHIHAILYCKRAYIDGSKIKVLKYPYRYECALVRNETAYNNYLIKEKNNVSVSIYCQTKGIPQFWDGSAQD